LLTLLIIVIRRDSYPPLLHAGRPITSSVAEHAFLL
jgi:hypothetical protein